VAVQDVFLKWRADMIEKINFDLVADLYDYYVNVDFDINFFLTEAKKVNGKVLELTSGTGRVSIPLLSSGIDLTCVDYSKEMLAILKRKIKDKGFKCSTFEMDITELSLKDKYDLIMIPFNSLSEIVDPRKHRKTLKKINEHLTDNGVFNCTLHNPQIRLKTVDGEVRLMGNYQIENNRMLIIKYLLNYNAETQIVSGYQFYEVYDNTQNLIWTRNLEINFYLFEKEEFEGLIKENRFRIKEIYGNYDYSRYEVDSPYIIYKMEKN
jgi:SAM-dependent methyltransferase